MKTNGFGSRQSGVGSRWSVGLASAAGFTLIELLVVVSLVVLLASIGMNQYRNSLQYAREAVLKEDLFRMRDAIDQYHADKGKYPQSLEDLVTDGYLRELPKDPITGATDTWQTVAAEPDPQNPSAEPGIYDVKSGSDGTALDGTAYSEWD
jgi:general secretion pathway protein G